MADQLQRVIYHEKQEPDSNLCAQHALNNLLQQPIFTAPDLATIAGRLDTNENSYLDRARSRSMNMDDSGFFSVQVLEEALQVWGLTLVRWRSEAMKDYQNKPHVLFGPAEPELSQDQGVGHWFNLNSFVKEPEWVSKTYLGMVLQQAEAEGYSVFAVCQMDPLAHLALPRMKADEVAAAIPEITNASKHLSTSRKLGSSSGDAETWASATGIEDEDPELQAALLASVMGAETSVPLPSSSGGRLPDTHTDDWDISHARSAFGSQGPTIPLPSVEDTPSSLEQTQRDLANFQASRAQARGNRSNSGMSPTQLTGTRTAVLGDSSAPAPTRRRAPREDEEEEEMIRRAIEASRQETEEREKRGHDDDTDEEDVVYFDEEDQHMYDEGEEEREELERLLRERRQRRQEEEEQERYRQQFEPSSFAIPPAAATFDPFETGMFGANAAHLERHYDDEDAELQAALKASLEGADGDLTVPPPPKAPTRAPTRAESPPTTSKATDTRKKAPVVEEEEEGSSEEEDTEEETESEAPAAKPLTAEELRKARLARFGS